MDPSEIPGGYSAEKHRGLKRTIAEPGSLAGLLGELRMMACHETAGGSELPCVGWLAHQLGPGNNIALRLKVHARIVDGNVETVGPQHGSFEETLPRRRRARG